MLASVLAGRLLLGLPVWLLLELPGWLLIGLPVWLLLELPGWLLAELAGRLADLPILRDVNFPCKIFCDNF